MLKKTKIIVLIIFIIAINLFAKKNRSYTLKNSKYLSDSSISVLVIPIDSISIEYYDDTKIHPDTQYTDSAFLYSANSLLFFEASKRYKRLIKLDLKDTLFNTRIKGYSNLLKKGDEKIIGEIIKKVSENKNVDAVIFIYNLSLKHITTQPEGWRSSPEYQKPLSYKAISKVHLQLWSKDGKLIAETIGKSDTGKPFLYSLLKSKQKDRDVVAFAKRFYAPPIIRSLNKAIKKALSY